VAPVSLPPVGGFATARSGAFNLEEIVSCSAAYTRVSGREHHADGSSSISISTTAVVEDLNLLDVVTAKRVVSQVSIFIPRGSKELQISFAGSRFEGLLLAGCGNAPTMNSELNPPGCERGGLGLPLTWQDMATVAGSQAEKLIGSFKNRGEDAYRWAQNRHGRMISEPPPGDGAPLLCSLVDGFNGEGSKPSCGHIVEIPGFGRIFLGEIRFSRDSVQLVAIRAELGCPVRGSMGFCAVGGGGSGEN
jgi:hypothetical protein